MDGEDSVEIDQRWNTHMRCRESDYTIEDSVVISMAGWQAEHRFHGLGAARCTDSDLYEALNAAQWKDDFSGGVIGDTYSAFARLLEDQPDASDDDLIAMVRAHEATAAGLVQQPDVWAAIEAVARLLIDHGKLDADQVHEAIEAAWSEVEAMADAGA